MSALIDLIQQAKESRDELVATTIRLPRRLSDFVDDFAEQHSKSKQEVLVLLVEEGVLIAEKALKDHEEKQSKRSERCAFQLLNTNKRHSPEDHNRMVQEGIAAAFNDPWKHNINRINKGDVVFLYENGVGVVAYGIGSGETVKEAYDGEPDACHYQVLQDFKVLRKPIHASNVKKILGRNVVFLATMAAMPDGDKLLNAIHQAEKE